MNHNQKGWRGFSRITSDYGLATCATVYIVYHATWHFNSEVLSQKFTVCYTNGNLT